MRRGGRAGLPRIRASPVAVVADGSHLGRLDTRTVVVSLTHDPNFDLPLLRLVLDLGGTAHRLTETIGRCIPRSIMDGRQALRRYAFRPSWRTHPLIASVPAGSGGASKWLR
jgi:hypothetical protein